MPLVVRPGLVLADADLGWRFSRSSGPGGQSVNTSDSRVELSYDVRLLREPWRARALERLAPRLRDGVLTVTASEQRSQLQNRGAAQDRLLEVLRTATAPPPRPRRPTRPRHGAVERRLESKAHRGRTKRLRREPRDE